MGLQGLGWEGDGFSESELGGVRAWLFGKATTNYGGSTEIQNNNNAKRVLGMHDHQKEGRPPWLTGTKTRT